MLSILNTIVPTRGNESMQTIEKIKPHLRQCDLQRAAEIVGCSLENVKKVVKKERPDNFKIVKVLGEIIAHRDKLTRKYNRKLKAEG